MIYSLYANLQQLPVPSHKEIEEEEDDDDVKSQGSSIVDVKDIGGDINKSTKQKIDDFLALPQLSGPSKQKSSTWNNAPSTSNLLSQSLLQRREWAKQFNLENKVLYDLFSEFQSMMNIAKTECEGTNNNKMRQKSPISEVLPIDPSQKMSTLHKAKMLSKMQNADEDNVQAKQSCHPLGLDVPLVVFKKYCKAVKTMKPSLVDKFLHSLGIEIGGIRPRVSFEIFLQLCCLLKFKSSTKDQYIDFFVGCFDPYNRGVVKMEDFESTMDCLFKDQF